MLIPPKQRAALCGPGIDFLPGGISIDTALCRQHRFGTPHLLLSHVCVSPRPVPVGSWHPRCPHPDPGLRRGWYGWCSHVVGAK